MATIQKRKNSYLIRVSTGYDHLGKQIVKSMTWKPEIGQTPKQIEKALNEAAVLFEKRVRDGLMLEGSIKFSDFSEKWIKDYAEKDLELKTVERYKALLVRINAGIGHIKIDKILPHHLLEFYSNLAEDGINSKTGGKLSEKTILHHHRLIHTILSTAVRWQVILSNPAERINPPKVKRKEARFLDEQQAQKVIELLSNEPIKWKTPVALLIYSGLRRGELCGLEWKDIDFANSIIHVQRSVLYVPKVGIYQKDTKNTSSNRVIKLPKEVFDLLNEYKEWQDIELKKQGDRWVDNDKIFTKENGLPIHPDSITDWVSKFVSRHNLPKFSPHSLRHTNATLLIAAGIPLRTVAQKLGHAQTSTTSNIYTHSIKTIEEIAADAIGDILKPVKKE